MTLICALWPWHGALAIDVDPSKKTVPKKFFDPGGGKGFNLFAGDPKRIERANAIRKEDFEISMTFQPDQLAVPASSNEAMPQIRAGLVVRNISKRPKTLTFPNSQRVDVVARSADGREIYRWAADKQFVESVGTSIVMPGEKVAFLVDIPLSAWGERHPKPGQTIAFLGVLANYPEFSATTNVVFAEGAGMPPPTPAIASGTEAPSPAGLPSLAPVGPVTPSLPIPEMPGQSAGFGLTPGGDAMPGFSLGSGSGPDGGHAPGTSGAPADPLPRQ
ncbi:MAG TPA: BsuPI-related putative proteinase inhibitor [Verrucomicrobiae bacterium]|nr:BsuPI-related putative proteinase inhibitor [Verrucomicrobiae bacterium]